jgi:fumarate reductase subunit D
MAQGNALASGAGHYVHWGVISISVTNIAIVGVMVILFVLALLLPFGAADGPGAEDDRSGS